MGSWVYQPQPGPDGADGKSAYEVAKENGFPGTEAEWLESLKGEDGDASTVPGPDGADGKSAYEIAVENGFPGTEQEWLDSLVGPEGPGGTVAATPYEQIEVVGPTLELADSTFGHILPNTAHFDQIEMFPVGMIISWVGDYGQVPNGWLLCHGQNLTGYESDLLRLYQIMPDYHGVGYFHAPDFRGRSPIGVATGLSLPVCDIALGQRDGDSRVAFHTHGIGHDTMGTTQGNAQWAVGNTINTVSTGPAVYDNDWVLRSAPQGTPDIHPVTGVNFLIYCGQDTFAIKDTADLGNTPPNVQEVTTRSMIEARLAEAGIGEEEIKILKEQLEELKRTEAK